MKGRTITTIFARAAACMLLASVLVTSVMPEITPAAETNKKIELGTTKPKKWKTTAKIKAPVITEKLITRRTDNNEITKLNNLNTEYNLYSDRINDITWRNFYDKESVYRYAAYTSSIDKTDAHNTITVDLSWDKVKGASGYEIRAKQTYDGHTDAIWRYARTKSNNVQLWSYWFADDLLDVHFWFAADASYKIQVRAYKKSGTTYKYGAWSDTVKITGKETIANDISCCGYWDTKSKDYYTVCKIPGKADGVELEYEIWDDRGNNILAEGTVVSTEIERDYDRDLTICIVRYDPKIVQDYLDGKIFLSGKRVRAYKNNGKTKTYSAEW